MSGYSGSLQKGVEVICGNELKIVDDWIFFSSPIHNSDEILVLFTDGTSHRGLYGLYTKKELQKEIAALKKKLRMFSIAPTK